MRTEAQAAELRTPAQTVRPWAVWQPHSDLPLLSAEEGGLVEASPDACHSTRPTVGHGCDFSPSHPIGSRKQPHRGLGQGREGGAPGLRRSCLPTQCRQYASVHPGGLKGQPVALRLGDRSSSLGTGLATLSSSLRYLHKDGP